MRAGQMRHLLAIEEPHEAPESTMGAVTPAWRDYVTRWWAVLEPVSGSERFVSPELLATATHTIRGRYADGVTVKMRARLGSGSTARYFAFQAVIDRGERRRELVITAVEEVPARA